MSQTGNRSGTWKTAREFLLLVVGVLAALTAEGWVSERGDRELARTYLADLRTDLEADSATQARLIRIIDNKIEWLDALLADLNETGPRLDPAEQLVGLNTAAIITTAQFAEGTYRDLVGSGNLRLLSPVHRSSIVRYYTLLATSGRAVELFENQGKPPFTGLIPGRARRVFQNCGSSANCGKVAADSMVLVMPRPELAELDGWRTRPGIRDQLQVEMGNAFSVRGTLEQLASALAVTRAVLSE